MYSYKIEMIRRLTMNLQSSIIELKGIGEKTSLPFAKVGIHTVLDLLEYYPRDYEIYEEPVELTEIEVGKNMQFMDLWSLSLR